MKNIFAFLITLFVFFIDVPSSSDDAPIKFTSTGLTNVGYATFNLTSPDFNCRAFIRSVKNIQELHVTFLYNTFGNDFSCLTRLLSNERLKTLQVHLINEPGHRNNRLGSYEFLKDVGTVENYNNLMKSNNLQLKRKFNRYVQPLVDVLDQNLNSYTNLIINPGLESNLSDRAGKVLVSWAREVFPDARIVWNPLVPNQTRLARAEADFIEGHNLNPEINDPCIYNMDGTDVSLKSRPAIGEVNYKEGESKNWLQSGPPVRQLIEEYANRCEVAFIWTAESNGIDESNPYFIDPRKRDNNIPYQRYSEIMEDIEHLQSKGKIYPPIYEYDELDDYIVPTCDKIITEFEDGYKKGKLLKQSELRDRGGVIILPSKFKNVDSIQLIKQDKVVDVYQNSGTYHDGRVLFRSDRSPTTYPIKTYLTFSLNNQTYCYKIPNPRIRLD